MNTKALEQFLCPIEVPVGVLSVKASFDKLTDAQQLYAHHAAKYITCHLRTSCH